VKNDTARKSAPRPGALPHVSKTLGPGQPGTLRLQQHYGDALVCVRYRRDATGLRRGTTVEILVAETLVNSAHTDRQLFDVEIGYAEHALRAEVKAHGGTWNPRKQLWQLTGAAVKQLGLIDRVRVRRPG
jgi:hypothetical protein